MEKKMVIRFGNLEFDGILNDCETSKAIWDILPIESTVHLWGEEIFFETQVVKDYEGDETNNVKRGDIGYWPTGRALCIFFGPTPLSQKNEIVPVAPVTIIGTISGKLDCLKQVEEREIVTIKRRENKEV